MKFFCISILSAATMLLSQLVSAAKKYLVKLFEPKVYRVPKAPIWITGNVTSFTGFMKSVRPSGRLAT